MPVSYVPSHFVWGLKNSSKYEVIDNIVFNLTNEHPEQIPIVKYEDKDYDFFIKRSEKCICFASVFRASYDVTLMTTILNLLSKDALIENLIGGKKMYRVFVFYNAQFLSRNALKILGNYMKKTQNTHNRIIIESDQMGILTEEIRPYVQVHKITDDKFMNDLDININALDISKTQSEKYSTNEYQTKDQTINHIVELLFTNTKNISTLFDKIKELILTLWTSNLDYVLLLQKIYISITVREKDQTRLKDILCILTDTDITMKKDCYNDYTHIQNMIYQIYCVIHKKYV